MLCPECKRRMPDVADSCRCGWQRQSVTQRSYVHCAHETCPVSAMCRVKTATGWANFCQSHYDAYHRELSAQFCAANGLDTREKQMAFIREKMATGMFKQVPALREPGEDSDTDVYGEAA